MTNQKNLKEINGTIKKNGYFDQFPSKGVEVVSWYVAMGIGQIITNNMVDLR
jgi:hypothetical protein